jgi:hypothetical protein
MRCEVIIEIFAKKTITRTVQYQTQTVPYQNQTFY